MPRTLNKPSQVLRGAAEFAANTNFLHGSAAIAIAPISATAEAKYWARHFYQICIGETFEQDHVVLSLLFVAAIAESVGE